MGTEVASTVSTRGIYANDDGARATSARTTATSRPGRRRPRSGGRSTTRGRGSPAGSCGPASTIAASRRRTTGRASARTSASSTCAASRRTSSTTTRRGGASKPVLHLFPHWNWAGKEGQESRCGASRTAIASSCSSTARAPASRQVKKNSHVAWKVPYAPGAIEARGVKAGQPDARRSARDDRRAGEDRARARSRAASPPTARICRSSSRRSSTRRAASCRRRPMTVTFTVSGPGRVIGVGNGDPSSHEPDRASKRNAFNGLCMALVQSQKTPGEIRVEASAPGLASATAILALPRRRRDRRYKMRMDADRRRRGPRGLLPEARHRRGPPS